MPKNHPSHLRCIAALREAAAALREMEASQHRMGCSCSLCGGPLAHNLPGLQWSVDIALSVLEPLAYPVDEHAPGRRRALLSLSH